MKFQIKHNHALSKSADNVPDNFLICLSNWLLVQNFKIADSGVFNLKLFLFFITITNRKYANTTGQYEFQKHPDFNELHEAFTESLYFCILRYFSARCREINMLVILLSIFNNRMGR